MTAVGSQSHTMPAISASDPINSDTPTPSTENLETTKDTSSVQPPSPIGYEIPCGVPAFLNTSGLKIVGGSAAQKGEFPWLVTVQLYSGSTAPKHICAGTIISSYWVVTAAHCVHRLAANSLSVVAGDYHLYTNEGEEQRRDVVRIVEDRRFSRYTFAADIALLQLDPPLDLQPKSVAPICLPAQDQQFNTGWGVVGGWGRLSERGRLPTVVHRVNLPLIEKATCDRLYRRAGYGRFVHRCQLCAGSHQGGLDSCQGDSGGGLGCVGAGGVHYLCGVVSWGVGCARTQYPSLYTQVSCFSRRIYNLLYNTQTGFNDRFYIRSSARSNYVAE